MVDGADVDYVCANFGDWSNINQAIHIDLSADMNGDLVVDADDVVEMVEGIFDSSMGDFDLDGDVDADDLAAWDALNGSGCPADLNEDGVLDFFDISFFLSNMVDFNEDTMFDFFDISAFLGAYGPGCPRSKAPHASSVGRSHSRFVSGTRCGAERLSSGLLHHKLRFA